MQRTSQRSEEKARRAPRRLGVCFSHCCGAMLLAAALLLLGGCEAPTKVPPPSAADVTPGAVPDQGIKVKDLANANMGVANPSMVSEGSERAAGDSAVAAVSSRQVLAQTMMFPRQSPRLTFATQMLDTRRLDSRQVAVWQANGFGVGIIDRSQLPLLMANLPTALAVETGRLRNPVQYAPLTLVERITGAQRVRVFDSLGRDELRRITSGKAQVLMKLVTPLTDTAGDPLLDLVPHHFKPVSLLLPRSPDQRQLDGVSFGDLRLVQKMSPNDILVLWLAAGNPITAEEAPGEAGDPESVDATTGDVERRGVADREMSVAELLLTGHRRTRPVQMMLLITVAEDAPR